jgi:hypothetical protein
MHMEFEHVFAGGAGGCRKKQHQAFVDQVSFKIDDVAQAGIAQSQWSDRVKYSGGDIACCGAANPDNGKSSSTGSRCYCRDCVVQNGAKPISV